MRILMTGFTTLQVGRPGKYRMTTFANLLPQALRLAGHEVDQRAVTPGDALDRYDVVLVGMIAPNILGAGHRYGALDAIRRARREAGALGFFLDDWAVDKVAHDVDYLRRDPKRLVKPMLKDKPGFDWATTHLDELVVVLDALAERPWPVTLVPKFDFGDGQILVDRVRGLTLERTVFVDPSGLAVANMAALDLSEPQRQEDRVPVWLSAALAEKKRWLKDREPVMTWPVHRLGAGASKVTEPQVIDLYGEVNGAVALPYPHVGSGWWRNRFDFAAERGALLLADPRETVDLAPGFAQPANTFEAMSPELRERWAAYQRDLLRSRRWPVERFVAGTDAALRRIISGSSAPLPGP